MTLLLASVLDVTVVMLLSIAAAAALSRRSAAQRHAVLAAAIVAATLAPALELIIPPVPVFEWNDAAPAASSGLTFTPGPAASLATPDGTAVAASTPWATLLFALWTAGAAVTLLGLLTGLVRLARLTARCAPIRSGRWRELADELSSAAGLRRRVQLLQSTDRSLLVTCGLLHAKIILPAGAAAWHDDRRRVVLAHELAHIRRNDGTVQLAGELLRIVHWFNPLVWVACRRLRQESEYACDDAVLKEGMGATEYATHLLEIARHAAGRRHTWASAPAIAHPSTLERRIAAMLNPYRTREPLSRRAWVIAILLAAIVIVPLAAAGVAPSAQVAAVIASSAADTALAPLVAPASESPLPARRVRVPPASIADVPAPAPSRQAPARIAGRALDQTGAALPGARLTLTDPASGIRSVIVSDTAGRFTFADLQPAQYELSASLPGFATVNNVIPLAAGASVDRIIMLPVGGVQETIHVLCGVPAAAVVSPPVTVPGQARDGAGTERPAGLRQALSRAVQALIPVLSAQQPPPPVRVGGNLRAPNKLKDVAPICPMTFIPANETIVTLAGRIGVDGYLNDVTPLASDQGIAPPSEFTQSALDALRQWAFLPTLLNGQAVETNITIRVFYRRG